MKASTHLRRLVLVFVLWISVSVGENGRCSFRIVNAAGVKIEVYWVEPTSREGVLLTTPDVGMFPGLEMPFDSFVGHEFEIREMPAANTGECANESNECHSSTFFVSETENQYVVVKPGLEILFTDTLTASADDGADVLANCRQQAMESLASDPDSALESINRLASCVQLEVARKFEDANVKLSFEEKVRTSMAGVLENYTCADDTLDSSPDVSNHYWTMPDATRMVHVKHDRPASKIHVVENFISEDECLAMETEAALTLHRATVADGKGGSQLSPNRKAMQAGIAVEWDKEEEGDLIARLSRRVYDYAEHVLKLGINEHGQEDLMSIQYFGRGRNDTEPDRYTPHCDGDCTGLPHKTGNRVATMVMYCKLPTDGGSTNFRNSAVHIKPVAGNAIFFSYIEPISQIMDTGFTEHSGCPVFEGEKKIVTQWIRYGVDDENPWDAFNTLGIKISEADDQ